MSDVPAVLDGLPLFDGVARDHIEAAGQISVRHFADRDTLIELRGVRRSSYVLLEGRIKIEVKGIRVAERGRLEIVGEQAFIDGLAHSADVIAEGDVRALEIPETTMEALLLNSVFARNLLTVLSGKLREATNSRYVRYAQRERLFASFGQYVGRRQRDRLLENGTDFGRPTFCPNAVVMFTDVRGFTAKSNSMDPMVLADELNGYMSAIVDIVHEANGFVSAFLGDGTMSFWGYPGIGRVEPDRILEAAEHIIVASRSFNLGGEPIRTGVGINVGELFIGNVGSEERRQYIVLGDTVNLAARFEGLTKKFKADLVCSAAFYNSLLPGSRHRFTEHVDVEVRGAPELMNLYTLTLASGEGDRSALG